jgi:hypothetical protein
MIIIHMTDLSFEETYQYVVSNNKFPEDSTHKINVIYQLFLDDYDIYDLLIHDSVCRDYVFKLFKFNNTLDLVVGNKNAGILLMYYSQIDTKYHRDLLLSCVSDYKRYRYSICHFICRNYSEELIDIFISNLHQTDFLYFDIYDHFQYNRNNNYVLIIEKFLQHNIPVNNRYINHVIADRDIDILKLFIKYNIDVNRKDDDKIFVDLINDLGVTTETLLSIMKAMC